MLNHRENRLIVKLNSHSKNSKKILKKKKKPIKNSIKQNNTYKGLTSNRKKAKRRCKTWCIP